MPNVLKGAVSAAASLSPGSIHAPGELMQAHEVIDLLEARRRNAGPYVEFLRVPAISCGIYKLPRGGTDPQSPHAEDEVYYVLRGRARIRVGPEDRGVRPGSFIFVPARVAHRFHDIEKTLAVLVLFAPAEGTRDAQESKST